MFIRKITKIENIGRFHRGGVSGGEYRKYTLFYAGNGRGKTTICAILRSLQRNHPGAIQERQTLGTTGDPTAHLLLDAGTVSFKNGAWSAHHPDIHIFDGHFVTENVHGGEQVDTEHRRAFYRIVVGPVGVAYAKIVDELDAKITEKNGQIGTVRKALQPYIPKGLSVDQFAAIPSDPELDQHISQAEASLRAANQGAEIAARSAPVVISIPTLPESLIKSTEQTIETISAKATQQVQAQMARHRMHEHGEAWLTSGLASVHDDMCPFCGQEVKDNALLEAYKQYFSDTYQNYREQLVAVQIATTKALSDAEAHKLIRALEAHSKEVTFWRQFGEIPYTVPPSIEQLLQQITTLRETSLARLARKLAAPLDELPEDPAFSAAVASWEQSYATLAAYNAQLSEVATRVATIKAANTQTNKAAIEAELQRLQAIKVRYTEPVASLANDYIALSAEKTRLSDDKAKAKEKLDQYDGQVIAVYESSINSYLKVFGAGFRLGKCGKTYVGGVPQSVYCLEINGESVDITNKAQSGKPTFRTTMSAGDKNTLALAFFLAQLEQDQDLSKKVIVFDDPFTSLDEFRREMTAKSIKRVGEGASQVIVLSHDKYFLDSVYQKISNTECATFQLSNPTPRNTIVEEWQIEREVKEGYLQEHMRLIEFVEHNIGDVRNLRTAMRPLLEKYIRYRFPNAIPEGIWLGDMLGIIRNDPAHPLTPVYNTIDDINQYTAPFHHDTNAPFSEAEVRTYVERTLSVVGGC